MDYIKKDFNTFQYLSDIHFYQNDINKNNISNYIKPTAPNLLIAGDLGSPFFSRFNDIINYCSINFKNVFLIAGNHEYYNVEDLEETNTELYKICNSFNNVYFLNNSIHYLTKEVCVIGTILWSDINLKYREEMIKNINLFKYITYYSNDKNESIPITPEFLKNEFYKNYIWLMNEVERVSQLEHVKKIIILTHYPPLRKFKKTSKKRHDKLISAYCNNITEILDIPNNKIKLWICGHTHKNISLYHNNIFITSNCLGYIGKNNIEYKNNAIYTL